MRFKVDVSLDDAWASERLAVSAAINRYAAILQTITRDCRIAGPYVIDPNGNRIGTVTVED